MRNLINDIIKYGKIAGDKNYTPGISGNISARDENNNIIITATGTANGFLEPEDFVVLNSEGIQLQGIKKASSEKLLHIEFYKKRKDINAVFHVHSPYLTAFATAGIALEDGVSPEIIYCFDKIPLALYALPGSNELVEKTSIYFEKYDVILLANHGVVVGGCDVMDAYLKLDLCENYAKTLICSNFLGGAKILSKDCIEQIKNLRN